MIGVQMITRRIFLAASLAPVLRAQQARSEPWTIYITNDSCSDFTWNNTAEDTLRAYAEIIRSHLDEMTHTDHDRPENQDHYNLSITGEALSFFDRYPERKDEFIRRVKEGRISISPFLNNSLFAFHGTEAAIRNFYPAARMQREWGAPLDVAEHIECPSMPWGVAPLLAACGVRWLSVPFLDFDSTFKHLEMPPIFIWEGADGSSIKIIFDKYASLNGSYSQGAKLLNDPSQIESVWLPHYQSLGPDYPLRIVLASGTHNDLYLKSTRQTHYFADSIRAWNADASHSTKLVNATLPQFCKAVDAVEEQHPFLKHISGCFGHSWDLWPLTTAKYASGMRTEGSRFLDLEAFATVAAVDARSSIRKAEWNWTMMADHAWNGANEANRRENSSIRRNWLADLERANDSLANTVWQALELKPSEQSVTVFNPTSAALTGLVRLPGDTPGQSVQQGPVISPIQTVIEDESTVTYFALKEIPAFGLNTFAILRGARLTSRLHASASELSGPFYTLRVDSRTGGLSSLLHVASGKELLTPGTNRTIGQAVYHDGEEHPVTNLTTKLSASGPVLARLEIEGAIADIHIRTAVTIYADIDRVDFDCRIHKPVSTSEQRFCHVFPVVPPRATLRVETTGVVIRPFPQPRGDLLPGADTNRFAVQGFVDATADSGFGVTIIPIEAFALRLDLDHLTFEALGNDQNYLESTRDQNQETDFRFRYSLQAHDNGWSGPAAALFSRSVTSPFLSSYGAISAKASNRTGPQIATGRAVVTAFKVADDPKAGGHILRVWERAGDASPLKIRIPGYQRAIQTDLLERDKSELAIANSVITVPIAAHGFASVRLIPT